MFNEENNPQNYRVCEESLQRDSHGWDGWNPDSRLSILTVDRPLPLVSGHEEVPWRSPISDISCETRIGGPFERGVSPGGRRLHLLGVPTQPPGRWRDDSEILERDRPREGRDTLSLGHPLGGGSFTPSFSRNDGGHRGLDGDNGVCPWDGGSYRIPKEDGRHNQGL